MLDAIKDGFILRNVDQSWRSYNITSNFNIWNIFTFKAVFIFVLSVKDHFM
jgi:hypothetical protein